MSGNSKRIGYIDALRGFTMILVVFAHVEFLSFGIPYTKSVIGSMFISFRMPMFFFISGFIAYKAITWDVPYYSKMLKKKFLVQIIPTLFFFYLSHSVCHGGSFFSFFTHGPGGYWFTIVLFYMFLLYYTIMLLTHKSKPWISDALLILVAIIGALVYTGGMKYYDLSKYPVFCLINLSRYFEFFVLGVLCRKYQDGFCKMMSNEYVKIFLLLGFLCVFTLCWKETLIKYSPIHVFNNEFTVRYLGLFLVFAIFYRYRDTFETDGRITRSIRFIGRRTLDIYLLHYFFLPDLKAYKDILLTWIEPQNTLLELLVVLLITMLVISMCLLTSAIIRTSSFLGHYLLGAKLTDKR